MLVYLIQSILWTAHKQQHILYYNRFCKHKRKSIQFLRKNMKNNEKKIQNFEFFFLELNFIDLIMSFSCHTIHSVGVSYQNWRWNT
jgi:hypothetical protein